MNNVKIYTPILLLILVLGAGSFGVYKIHTYVSTFSSRVVEINSTLQNLEATKMNIELFKKILSKGSVEQEQIDSYILKGDTVFKAITDIEKDGRKAGLLSENSGIISVTKRENETLKKMNAGEVVVMIAAEGDTARVDAYIAALDNLPYVSHIERINIEFGESKRQTRAIITVVLTELI